MINSRFDCVLYNCCYIVKMGESMFKKLFIYVVVLGE